MVWGLRYSHWKLFNIKTYQDISKHIQTYHDISTHIQTYHDISKHIKTYPLTLSRLLLTIGYQDFSLDNDPWQDAQSSDSKDSRHLDFEVFDVSCQLELPRSILQLPARRLRLLGDKAPSSQLVQASQTPLIDCSERASKHGVLTWHWSKLKQLVLQFYMELRGGWKGTRLARLGKEAARGATFRKMVLWPETHCRPALKSFEVRWWKGCAKGSVSQRRHLRL